MIQRISASARGPPLAYIQVCIYGYPLLLSLLPVEGLEATAGGPEPSGRRENTDLFLNAWQKPRPWPENYSKPARLAATPPASPKLQRNSGPISGPAGLFVAPRIASTHAESLGGNFRRAMQRILHDLEASKQLTDARNAAKEALRDYRRKEKEENLRRKELEKVEREERKEGNRVHAYLELQVIDSSSLKIELNFPQFHSLI
jgi:hypothetical protein